eukprot:6012951-Amphidinium_carterae.1
MGKMTDLGKAHEFSIWFASVSQEDWEVLTKLAWTESQQIRGSINEEILNQRQAKLANGREQKFRQ